MNVTNDDLLLLIAINKTLKNNELKKLIKKLETQKEKRNEYVKAKMQEMRKIDKTYGNRKF